MTGTRLYKIFDGVKTRCGDNWNTPHKDYGLRWIKNLRGSFEEFYNDMGESYEKHVAEFWEGNTQLDRIDVNWNYCKENCRWVTVKEQQNNRRSNHAVTYKWVHYKSIKLLCEELWLPYARTLSRINKGRDINDAIEIGTVSNSLKQKWYDFMIKTMRDENNVNFVN